MKANGSWNSVAVAIIDFHMSALIVPRPNLQCSKIILEMNNNVKSVPTVTLLLFNFWCQS